MDISDFTYTIISTNGNTMIVEYVHKDPKASVVRLILRDVSNEPNADFLIKREFPCYKWCYELGEHVPNISPRVLNYYCMDPGSF